MIGELLAEEQKKLPPLPLVAPCGAHWAPVEEWTRLTLFFDGQPSKEEKVCRPFQGPHFSGTWLTHLDTGEIQIAESLGWRAARTCVDGHLHRLELQDGMWVEKQVTATPEKSDH